MGRLRIRNETPYPSDEMRRLVKFALSEIDTTDTCVRLVPSLGSGGYAGKLSKHRFNAEDRKIAGDSRYFILVRVPLYEVEGIEHTYHNGTRGKWIGPGKLYWKAVQSGTVDNPGRWPVIIHNSLQEYIVGMTAHEGKHIEQIREGLKVSEVAAEWFEDYMLRRYREEIT